MLGYRKMLDKIRAIKKLDYVKTHRSGNTGVGKTLEDLLGIMENNIPGPNGKMIELKSARTNATSMLTLFTKSPSPVKANSLLLNKIGYKSSNGRKELHTTLNALNFNNIKGKPGLQISVKRNKLVIIDPKGNEYGYWDKETLKKSFERKLPKIVYVKAESRGNGAKEEFWYNEAWLLKGFSFANFIKLINDGVVLVDVRIGQYSDGRPHDHGTGFRVSPKKLDMCFSNRKRIV